MENSSLEEYKRPPESMAEADLVGMPSLTDAETTSVTVKDLPLPCQTSSSNDNLHSNNVVINKTEEIPETTETNLLEKVKQSKRKPRKTQKITKVEEKQKFTDDENLAEYILPPTSQREGAGAASSVMPSTSQFMKLDSSLKTEANTTEDAVVQGTVQAEPESVDTSSGKDIVPSKCKKLKPGCLSSIIHCTACNRQIGFTTSLEIYEHPVLKVLVCKKCYKWYASAEIEKGADGMDEQCRWCSEGGDLICCDFCHNAFCKSCIRRNLGRKALMDILNADDESKWSCFICDSKPILHLVQQCASVMESLTRKKHSPKAPRQKEMCCSKKKGTRLKNVCLEVNPPNEQSFPKTSSSLTTQHPSSAAKLVHRKPASIYYRAVNPGHLSANLVANAQRMVSLPFYQKSSFMPTFPAIGQLRGPGFSSTVSSHATTSASWTAGENKSCLSIDNSVETLQKLDYMLSASNSMLNILTSLQEELSFVGGKSSGFIPLLAEGRRRIAARLWSAQRSYMQIFKSVVHREAPVIQSPAQQSHIETLQHVMPKGEMKWGGVGSSLGTGGQSFATRNYHKGNERIDLSCSSDEMVKKCAHLSTVSNDPLFAKCERDAGSKPFDFRLTNVTIGDAYKSDWMLFETTKSSLGNSPSCGQRKRKYPVTAS